MINPKEVRNGNILKQGNTTRVVDFEHESHYLYEIWDILEGELLTEQWLIDFEFQAKPETKWFGNGYDYQPKDNFTIQRDFVLGDFTVRFEAFHYSDEVEEAVCIVLGEWYPKCNETSFYAPIEFVHQFQNLYFSLKEKELELKTNSEIPNKQ